MRSVLFGLLRISVLRVLRSKDRRPSDPIEHEPLDTPDAATPSPEAALFTKYAYAEIAKVLERSCTLCEQEFLLLTFEGKDDTFIASSHGMTAGHVRVLRHRAISKLRKALATPSA